MTARARHPKLSLQETRRDLADLSRLIKARAKDGCPLCCVELRQLGAMLAALAQGEAPVEIVFMTPRDRSC